MNAKTEPEVPEPEEANIPETKVSDADIPEAEIVEEPAQEDDEDLTPEQRIERERDEYYENWRRTQADFQNHRRRQAQVIEASVKSARRVLFAELLLILDYLDMALLSPVESQEGKNLLMGVQMTRDQMMRFLEQHEVESIESVGSFDPERHEAVESITDSGEEPGTIVETVRRGYMAGGEVLRYAHVKVAAAADPADENSAESIEDGPAE